MESPPSLLWDRVAEFTKGAQEKGLDALAWAVHVSSAIGREGVALPSPDLARLLVSHICWENNVPLAWKYLEQAVAAGMAPPVLVIALLSTRVIPSRHVRVGPYRLYMEILKRHLFEFALQINGPNFEEILMMVDDILHLSQNFGVQTRESGVLLVEFVFSITWQLLDATLDDEGLLDLSPRKMSRWIVSSREMEIDGDGHFLEKRSGRFEKLCKANTVMAIELIGLFINHKVISRLLFLAHQNMPLCWEDFSRSLYLLADNSLESKSSTLSPETLLKFSSDNLKKIYQKNRPRELIYLYETSSHTYGQCHGASQSALWIPLDLYLEDAIVGSLAASDAIEIISGIVKALQAINSTNWHDTFIGLWMAALRVVQRERDPIEGPVPHLETRMCVLLSITTLSVANIIEEEASLSDEIESKVTNQLKERVTLGKRREALISSLQVLGDYESLLIPPQSLVSVANHAALKAMVFVSGLPLASCNIETIGVDEKIARCSGNLRHLIVEACIARNLLDTSAYFWPGYITGNINQIPQCINTQGSGWSALMMGAPLTSSLTSVLMNTPARSLAELEKIFDIATNGLGDERIFAASVLCGASLLQGWNLQEHTVGFVVKLLSPPLPDGYSGSDSHLISHAPVLDVVLSGISSVDCAQVFSLYGLVPELAAALMPVCEVFGSCIPNTSWTLPFGEQISVHSVFSIAFIFLLRLWEFNHTPIECCIVGESPPVGSQLTPEYLLLLRNSKVMPYSGEAKNRSGNRSTTNATSVEPIFVDMFPKLKTWYRQHQDCLASTLSNLVPGTSVHQTVDCLLNMMFKKISKGSGQPVGSELSGSSLSGSTTTGSEDTSIRPMLPAWDIMQAVPYVVDAALTACAYGRMSPRELATGLKDLADFLPSSLATIVSYFSAEVTRGVWKPAYMNGTDWPSPAANLSTVEEHIKNIVAATGVDVPSLAKVADTPATLSLPLAAFVSLTITYKLDKASERFLNLAGPALENLSASCPWPSMPIVAALWTQKVKRWSDFLTFSASRTVFQQNNDTAVQLLKSCFAATLGLSMSISSGNGGVGSLLGHGFGCNFSGGLSPVAPGILYLQVYRSIRDTVLLTEEILSLVIFSVRQVASSILSTESREKLKKSRHRMRYGQVSYVTSLGKVKVAASLGATLVWLAGGSGLVQRLFREILPSWFLNLRCSDQQAGSQGTIAMLEGSALAYFAILSAMFSWGIDSTPLSKRRPKVIGIHLNFLADALEEKISLGCNWATWRAYVLGFLGLMLDCAPNWVLDAEVNVLKRISRGLRQWNEEELALLLLGKGGWRTMGAAAELVVANEL